MATPDPKAPTRDETSSFTEPQEYATLVRKAAAYDCARERLKRFHTRMAEDRERWARNTEDPCSVARAIAYQGDMHVVARIIFNIETIAGDRP